MDKTVTHLSVTVMSLNDLLICLGGKDYETVMINSVYVSYICSSIEIRLLGYIEQCF